LSADETADLRELLRASAKERAQLEQRVEELEHSLRRAQSALANCARAANLQLSDDAREALRSAERALHPLVRVDVHTTDGKTHPGVPVVATPDVPPGQVWVLSGKPAVPEPCEHEWEPNTDLSGWRCERCGQPKPAPEDPHRPTFAELEKAWSAACARADQAERVLAAARVRIGELAQCLQWIWGRVYREREVTDAMREISRKAEEVRTTPWEDE
jgi:hypothetical protein